MCICDGHIVQNCPVCGIEPETCKCCNGIGEHLYFADENGNLTPVDSFENVPKLNRYSESCEECKGSGIVE